MNEAECGDGGLKHFFGWTIAMELLLLMSGPLVPAGRNAPRRVSPSLSPLLLLLLLPHYEGFLLPVRVLSPSSFSHRKQQARKQPSSLWSVSFTSCSEGLEVVDELLLLDGTNDQANQRLLRDVQTLHEKDVATALASSLVLEDTTSPATSSSTATSSKEQNVAYEWFPNNKSSHLNPLKNHGHDETEQKIAIRTIPITTNNNHQDDQPILSRQDCQSIQRAAERLWKTGTAQPRFTYQYSTNQEAHVCDFALAATKITKDEQQSPLQDRKDNDDDDDYTKATKAINSALKLKLYPLIRQAFPECLSLGVDNGNDRDNQLFVYDALVIRYNATAAATTATSRSDSPSTNIESVSSTNIATPNNTNNMGAGQPLHRDLGLVSINIMLNGVSEFQGGGTFFEQQLLLWNNSHGDNINNNNNNEADAQRPLCEPIKPVGIGQAVLHESCLRHAGAATIGGVRDILVIFVSSTVPPPKIINARLKTMTAESITDTQPQPTTTVHDGGGPVTQYQRIETMLRRRMRRQRMAIEQVPTDGEAHQYLGTALMEYAQLQQQCPNGYDTGHIKYDPLVFLDAAIDCLESAKALTPCDARVYNNLGIALKRKAELLLDTVLAPTTMAPTKSTIVATVSTTIEASPSMSAFDEQYRNHSRQYYIQQAKVDAEAAYRRGFQLLQQFQHSGCNNMGSEVDRLSLNYGLFLSKQDRFEEACRVLEGTARTYSTATATDDDDNNNDSCVQDVYQLWKYCHSRMAE